MTRGSSSSEPSAREQGTERAVVRAWVRGYLEERLETGFDLSLSDADGADTETVCIVETTRFTFHVAVEALPAWIDPETDLPVEADSV